MLKDLYAFLRGYSKFGYAGTGSANVRLFLAQLPCVPIDAEPGGRAIPGMLLHKGIHKNVRCCIGSEADATQNGGERGKQETKVEIVPLQDLVQNEESVDFGVEVPVAP